MPRILRRVNASRDLSDRESSRQNFSTSVARRRAASTALVTRAPRGGRAAPSRVFALYTVKSRRGYPRELRCCIKTSLTPSPHRASGGSVAAAPCRAFRDSTDDRGNIAGGGAREPSHSLGRGTACSSPARRHATRAGSRHVAPRGRAPGGHACLERGTSSPAVFPSMKRARTRTSIFPSSRASPARTRARCWRSPRRRAPRTRRAPFFRLRVVINRNHDPRRTTAVWSF